VKAGGIKTFSDDRRTLISTLPEPYEFGPGIISPDEISKRENAAHIAGLKEAVEIVAAHCSCDDCSYAVDHELAARIAELERTP